MDPEEEKRLRGELFDDEVNRFLLAIQEEARKGASLPQDTVSVAARLQYYRVYFENDGNARTRQVNTATEWIYRALIRDPMNPDLQIKLADLLEMQNRYREAASIIERLAFDQNSPQYVQQWLGYILLFIEGRERDAIKASLEFQAHFPDEAGSLFNAACGYAQLYAKELKNQLAESAGKNRAESLCLLKAAIAIDPRIKNFALRHISSGDSFESLRDDPEFIALTGRPLPQA